MAMTDFVPTSTDDPAAHIPPSDPARPPRGSVRLCLSFQFLRALLQMGDDWEIVGVDSDRYSLALHLKHPRLPLTEQGDIEIVPLFETIETCQHGAVIKRRTFIRHSRGEIELGTWEPVVLTRTAGDLRLTRGIAR